MATKVIFSVGLILILSLEVISQENNGQFQKEGFYKNSFVEIKNIYPNPASSVAILNYSITDPDKEVKIVLHDLLGSINKDYPLNPYEKSLKIDLQDMKEGVYFYTLKTDGETPVTKKLIVKK